MLVLIPALAGGVGAAARFVMDGEIRTRWRGVLPLSTWLINVLGSLVLGLVTGLTAGGFLTSGGTATGYAALAVIGFCGGFTTFSTAMFEAVQVCYLRRPWLAVGYLVGSAAGAVAAVVVGLALGTVLIS